jgi:hypothetical protein
LLVHSPLTVMVAPAGAAGKGKVLPTMSAWGVITTANGASLFSGVLSSVALPALPRTLTGPEFGAVKLTRHTKLAPTAREAAGDSGVQVTVALTGKPDTRQVAVVATLGPLFKQVTVPVTVLPARAVAGNPLTVAAMSATGVMPRALLSTLFNGVLSCVKEPAVVLIVKPAPAGATKVLLHVIVASTSSTKGVGDGKQDCVAPGGKPESAQVGVTARLGPLLVQTPLTVTVSPALGMTAGTVVTACMSAIGTIPKDS